MVNCGISGLLAWFAGFFCKFGVTGIMVTESFIHFLMCVILECIIRKVDLNTVEIDLED